MTEFRPTDEEYNDVKKEVEEIDLERMEAEAKKSKERDEALRTFEGLSHRLESGKSWFDIPPPPPPPSIGNDNNGNVDTKEKEIDRSKGGKNL